MANQTISTTFKVVDEMSPAFQKMNKALQNLDGSLSDLEGNLNGIDSKEIEALKDSVKQTESAFNGLVKKATDVGNVSSSFKVVSNAAEQATQNIKTVSNEASSSVNSLKQVDGSGFKQVANAASQASQNVKAVGSDTSTSVSGLKQINGSGFKQIANNAEQASQNIKTVSSGVSNSANNLKQVSGSGFKQVATSASQASNSIKGVSNGASASANSLKQINGSGFKQVGSAAQTATGAVSELKNQANKVDRELDELERDASGLNDKFSGLKTAIIGAATAFASIQTAQAAIGLSDEMTQTTSRLNLMNDGLQTTEELQQQIKKAALNSHAEYSTLADTVAKLGNNAGDAFSNTSEIVSFAEQLSKQFAISGASADEMAAATLQLTQGLGSGVLRGDEFNSVMEQAPGIAQMIADYLEVDKSQIRDLASEGALSADVVKNAILGATDETNKKFDQMKVTFSQLWTDFKTNAMFAFKPVSEALSNLANNPKFQETVNNIGNGLVKLGEAAGGLISTLGNAFVNSFSWIVTNARFVISGITGITAAIGGLSAAAAINKAGGISEAIAKVGSAVANSGLAQSLLALINPATLAVAAIVGLGAATAALMASGTSLTDISKGFSDFDDKVQQFVNNFGSLIPTLVEGIKSKLPALASQAGLIMATLAEGILNSGVNLIGAGVQIIVKLAAGLAQAMPTIVSSGISFLTNLLNGILSAIPNVAETILQVLSNIVGTITENLPSMIQAGVDTIKAYSSGLGQNLPIIITQAFIAISGFIQTVAEHLPELITKGMELIGNLVSGILQNLPTLLATAVTLIGNFVVSLIQNLPQIIQAGVNLVGALVSGLIQSIPALLVGTAKLLGTIMQSLADLVPQALNKMLEVGVNIVEGLKQGFLNAWNGIGDFFSNKFNDLVGGIKNLLGINSPSTEFAGMGTNMVAGLQQGFDKKMPDAVDTINKAMAELQEITQSKTNALVASVTAQYNNLANNLKSQVTNMTDSLNRQWQVLANSCITILVNFNNTMINTMSILVTQITSSWNLMNNTVNSIVTKMASQLTSTVRSMVNTLKSTLSELPPHFKNVATQMMNGLISGIDAQKAAVVSTTSDLVTQIKTKFEEGLGIHSPSRYGQWVGEMLAAGLINGLSGSKLTQFVDHIIGDMKTSFENGNFDPSKTVDFLSDQATLDLIGKVSDIVVNPKDGAVGVPAIIQEALKYVGYHSPGGLDGSSIFGERYGNPSAWCVSFVRYCAENVGVPFPATNYVPDVLDWSIANGRYTQTPQPGYAAIFGGGSHIELVADVLPDGTVDMVGGNTGNGEVKHRPRSDATSYVALDGGHSIMTLKDVIQQAYNQKHGIGVSNALGNVAYDISAGASQWTPQVLQALQMLGQPASLLPGVLYAIQCESGGNPNAINDWDSNAAMGDPSRGLLQTIGSTFNAYRNPSLSGNIYDPLANIYAGLNYMIQRYGSVAAVVNPRLGGWYGYATGTENARKGWALVGEKGPELINFSGGEVVKNNSETTSILNDMASTGKDESIILNDMASTGGFDYTKLINTAAQNEVIMASTPAAPVNINVNNEIHNEGDLAGAESRITQTIAQTIRRERKVTGGIPHAY